MAGARESERQDTFDQIQLLLEDLRNVKVKIENHLLTASGVPFSKNTNEIKQKLAEIRAEYSSILNNVEKNRKEVETLKNNQESIDSNDKPEIVLEDSTYDSNIRNFNLENIKELKLNQRKPTLVYQLNTEHYDREDGYKPDALELALTNSILKLHKTRSEVTEETTKTRRTNSEYKTETIYKPNIGYSRVEEYENSYDHSPSDSENIVTTTHNKNLKKHIITIQEDSVSIRSDSSPPLVINDHVTHIKDGKERKPYSKNKAKHRVISSKYEPKHIINRSSPVKAHASSNRKGGIIHTSKTKMVNEEDFSLDDDERDGSELILEKLASHTVLPSQHGVPFKRSVVKMIHTKTDNKSIMSIVTNDEPQSSKMNLALHRSPTPDSIKKKMDIKEKEIRSLKDALKAAEKSNYKEADRLRTAKLSDDISDKLLHKSHECDELLEENIKLRKAIDELGIEIRDLELANLQLKNAKDSLEITNEKNAEENADLVNRVQLLQNELEKCHEVNDLKDQMSADLARVMSELKECQNSNKDQKNKLNLLKKDKDSKISDLEKKIENLKADNQENKTKIKELEDKNKFLEMKADGLRNSYEKKLTDQLDRLKSAETKSTKLQEKIPSTDVKKELDELKRANQRLNDDVKRLKDQNSTLQQEKLEMSKQKERCEKVINTIASENGMLKNERILKNCSCRDLENELALLKSDKMRLEHILNSTNERAMELNENKNQLIVSLDSLELQKMNLLQDLDLANQELARLRDENYQLELKYQQFLSEARERCPKDDESNDTEQLEVPSTHSTGTSMNPCSSPATNAQGTQNVRGYEFSINSGIQRSKFHGQMLNKSTVESSAQVFAIAIPNTEGDGRPKVECKKRLPTKKKC